MFNLVFNRKYLFYFFFILLFIHLFDKAAESNLALETKFLLALSIAVIIWLLAKAVDMIEGKVASKRANKKKKP